MSALATAPTTRPGGGRPAGARVAVAAVAFLLAAAPLAATVWTRSNLQVRIPKGTRVELDGASYATRDWSVSMKALEVQDGSRSADGTIMTSWVFHYTNTDREHHFASVTVRCLDNQRKERMRFTAKTTLQASRPDGATLEVQARIPEAEWKASVIARVVIDFLSSPEG